MFRKIALLICLMCTSAMRCLATEDSIRVSLLTCSPGPEVYELYGHTAIRCELPDREVDVVFNYGVFDFKAKHFAWRFALGECDYIVQAIPWSYFIGEYVARGSSITAQELNLTQQEALQLFERLAHNCLPENRTYRYNFLRNNCTTMVRDRIEETLGGQVLYPDSLPHYSYREMLHQYTAAHPWAQEANDLLLGADVDTMLSERDMMFAPEYFMRFCSGAIIMDADGRQRPLVRRTETPIAAQPQPDATSPLMLPWQALAVFGAICLMVMMCELHSRRICWLWDVVLLTVQGCVGTLIAFLFFFSEHPSVDSNWLLWLFNPLAFAGIPLVVRAATRNRTTHWHAAYFTVLALFLLFSPWIPQGFGKIIIPLALCLLTRPVCNHIISHQLKRD